MYFENAELILNLVKNSNDCDAVVSMLDKMAKGEIVHPMSYTVGYAIENGESIELHSLHPVVEGGSIKYPTHISTTTDDLFYEIYDGKCVEWSAYKVDLTERSAKLQEGWVSIYDMEEILLTLGVTFTSPIKLNQMQRNMMVMILTCLDDDLKIPANPQQAAAMGFNL